MTKKISYNVVLKGFDSLEQANAWVDWYSGQGEQDDCMGTWIGGGVSGVFASGNTIINGNSVEQDVTIHYEDERL